jgi:glutamate synthase domain-containing protein 3
LIVVLGLGSDDVPVGNFTGTGMHGGRIFIRTDRDLARLPAQVVAETASAEDPMGIAPYVSEFAGYFGRDAGPLAQGRFHLLRPNAKNPYKQLYTEN